MDDKTQDRGGVECWSIVVVVYKRDCIDESYTINGFVNLSDPMSFIVLRYPC